MFINKRKLLLSKASLLIIAITLPIFGYCIWFISEPARAARLDRYIIYNVDDLFRYNYIKMALYDRWIFLNPYVKPGYAVINTLFLSLVPLGISSLRIVNSAFSVGTLILVYKITNKMGFSTTASTCALLLMFTFPVYFLASISTLVETMFCFFLMLAIYLLYCRKLFLSCLVIAFMPTIRQEAIILIITWVVLLIKQIKIKYAIFLFFPFLIWSALNHVLLKHTLFYTFFCNLPDKAPPNCIASLPQFIRLLTILSIHPIFVTCISGLAYSYRNITFRYLLPSFVTYAVIIITANTLHFLDAKVFSREIRFLMPLIPFMAIYGAFAIERFLENKKTKKHILLFFIPVLVFIMLYQIKQLQKDAGVVFDSVSPNEEYLIKKTGDWVSNYIRSNKVKDVYVPGELTIEKITRRLWMYLPADIRYYAMIGKMESYTTEGIMPLDMAKYIIIQKKNGNEGIFITRHKLSKEEGLGNFLYYLLKEEPQLPLYIYLIQ